jgi:uncharacterized membrane protein YsdA (DUF1294 family)
MSGAGSRHFFHIRSLEQRGPRPAIGLAVSFALEQQEGKPPAAIRVRYADKRIANAVESRRGFAIDWCIATLQLAGLAVALGRGALPLWTGGVAAAGSALAFVRYNVDKRSAEKGLRRTPESALLASSVLGWPGALAAMQLFRHKSSKESFYIPFRLIGVAVAAALGWLALGLPLPG